MIVTELYNGQGLGNQLWCYFVTRIIAKLNNYSFGIKSPEKFKGKEFLEIDFGNIVTNGLGPEGGPPEKLPDGIFNYYKEKLVRHPNGIDISKEDKNLLLISDNTKIDGNMQSFEYIKNHKDYLNSIISIKQDKNIINYNNNDICIIHIRGGDYLGSSAFLTNQYYSKAISNMIDINKKMKFFIITDDINYSRQVCPNIEFIGSCTSNEKDFFKASHHLGGPIWKDWTILYNAKNIIMSASSFSFWPTWLNNNNPNVIAPMYWGDHKNSDGYWSCGDSLIPQWLYQNKIGEIFDYSSCLKRKNEYERENFKLWN